MDLLLQIAHLPRSSYYYHVARLPRTEKHVSERQAIRQICAEHQGRYGYRRVTLELRQRGYHTNHKLVMKLMAEEHLSCILRPKKYRSYRGEVGIVAPNRLNRRFQAKTPNTKWVTDISEFKVQGQKLYLSPLLDLFNGEIVSYSVSKTPEFRLVRQMLQQAFQKVPDLPSLMIHSDQGWQYQMKEYQRLLKEKGILQSMSRKGNCYDNSVMENFFGLLKTEFFYSQSFASVEQFLYELTAYIDYYNNKRIKVKLKGLSPVQFRTQSFGST
ncbi:MAG TPA: IS3 family transposase [Candidatus Paceibacterota bacterium]